MKKDGIDSETLLDMCIERLREHRRFFSRLSDDLWPLIQDLGEFLEHYDEWKLKEEDKDE